MQGVPLASADMRLENGHNRRTPLRNEKGPPSERDSERESERESDRIIVSASAPYRLVIADDHPLFRGALREAVTGLFERGDIAEAGTFNEVAELLERGSDVDLVLLDLT